MSYAPMLEYIYIYIKIWKCHICISVVNNHLKIKDVLSEYIYFWNIYCKNVSIKFDEYLEEKNVLNKFVGRIFWVWNRNYHL